MISTAHESTKLLAEHGRNVYSQFGEDGIIARIFEIIGLQSKSCIEFGAWDGFHMSNTANLWTKGWKGVLIEGHAGRYRQLVENVRQYDCHCINAYVSRAGSNRLEALLAKHGLAGEHDLLSIDIDGDDYYIFESLQTLRPRVIVCEYNPTIPAETDLFAEYGSYFGASVASLERIAETKGYHLVAVTDTNCFFVLKEDYPAFSEYETRLGRIRIDRSLIHVITGYNGNYVVSRPGPYGFNFPYKEPLIGPHQRVVFKSPLLRPFDNFLRHLKSIVRRIFLD